MKLLIINGVNLSSIGTREVNIYGSICFNDYFQSLKQQFPTVDLHYFQSNNIHEIVDCMQSNQDVDGIILNPGAYTHTSIVLADAVKAIKPKVVEVHISNLFGRESYRRNSMISAACSGFISGFGLEGYKMAIYSFVS